MKALLGTALTIALAAALPAMAQNAPATLSPHDQKFLKKASGGNVSEIRLGRLAEQKADSSEVKRFARRMVADHTKAEQQLKQDISGADIVVPAHSNKRGTRLYDRLAKESGAEFDRDYMRSMIDDHKHDIRVFKKEAHKGKMSELRDYAQNTLPVLHEHLRMAKKVDRRLQPNEGK